MEKTFKYEVTLKGFHHENLFRMEVEAYNRSHAVQIVGAIYYHCYLRAEIKEF